METRSPRMSSGKIAAVSAERMPIRIVPRWGVRNFGVHGGEDLGQEAVARHRIEDARLTVERNEHDAGEAGHGGDVHRLHAPGEARAGGLDGDGRGVGHVEVFVAHEPRHRDGHQDVENRADDERQQDADGHIALRVFRFLRRDRDAVEADVGGRRPCLRRARRRSSRNRRNGRWCWAGMSGVRVRGHDQRRPKAMMRTMTETLISTMRLLKPADSRTPATRTPVRDDDRDRRDVDKRARGNDVSGGVEGQRRVDELRPATRSRSA